MSFKTIQQDFGVTVDLGSYSFIFSDKTHTITDLSNGNVRITRRVDGIHELYIAPISSFVNLQGNAVATDFVELETYLKTNVGGATAGAGLTKSGTELSLKIASATELGGFKLGTGLAIDGTGKLSATAISEQTKTVSSQDAMMALPSFAGGYRVNRTDTQRLYYLNGGDDPNTLSNWIEGPSTALSVLTFNDRNGAVAPQKGDYKSSMIKVTHDDTGANGFFGIDNNGIYWDDGFDQLDNNGDTV